MTNESLESKINRIGSSVDMMRNSQIGPYLFPIEPEYTNWRDEQEAWRKTAILFNQSYHMTDLYIEGPDCYKLLSALGVNTFNNFGPNKAKQFVVCNYDGYVIGDSILYGIGENKVNIVGRPPTINWVSFHAETGDYDVTIRRDERSLYNPQPRETYRFQVQGPNAQKIFEKVNGGPVGETKFFHMLEFNIGDYKVTGLNHQMSGFPGFEFWGPADQGDAVKAVLVEAGAEFGLRLGGSRSYSTSAIESGWIPSPMPAIYAGDKMKPYREWLGANSFEAIASLGGSFVSDNIEDYYQTPWDLGYGFMVKFDHEFIGRAALEEMAKTKHRKKSWLYWDKEDVLKIFGSMYEQGDNRYKYMELPAGHYTTHPLDKIMKNGKMIGLSTYPVYSANIRGWISLCMIDEDEVIYGDEVTVVWGEPDGGTNKVGVERHIQLDVKAKIAPKPFTQIKA